ncbi:MAG: hypothetical protein FWD29_09030 [Micrococcales bacterium]|nr:hypothetical protein [Micrococcales bacterium]
MTDSLEKHHGWRAVEMAIKGAAKSAYKQDQTRPVEDMIRQTYYDRFLCRVFFEDSGWVLKGGSWMLARVPNARRTLDADLYRSG